MCGKCYNLLKSFGIYFCLVILIFTYLILLVLIGVLANPSDDVLTFGNVEVEDGILKVPILLRNNKYYIQGINFDVHYDPSLLRIEDVNAGELTRDWEILRIGSNNKTILLATPYSSKAIPVNSDGEIVVLKFKILGDTRERERDSIQTELRLDNITVSDPDGTVICIKSISVNISVSIGAGITSTGKKVNNITNYEYKHKLDYNLRQMLDRLGDDDFVPIIIYSKKMDELKKYLESNIFNGLVRNIRDLDLPDVVACEAKKEVITELVKKDFVSRIELDIFCKSSATSLSSSDDTQNSLSNISTGKQKIDQKLSEILKLVNNSEYIPIIVFAYDNETFSQLISYLEQIEEVKDVEVMLLPYTVSLNATKGVILELSKKPFVKKIELNQVVRALNETKEVIEEKTVIESKEREIPGFTVHTSLFSLILYLILLLYWRNRNA